MKIKLVVATRVSEEQFRNETATGRSLSLNRSPNIDLQLFPDNSIGLPTVYNQAIKDTEDPSVILVFAHDDLLLLDYFWANRIIEGLNRFDVLGLAGNKRRVPFQPSWAFVNDKLEWDQRENLSGVVGHGKHFPPKNLSVFGPTRQQVKLLDGLLLAVRNETLQKHQLRFDERFDFHFYDMDFCREAETRELRCGTWDISLIHESGGNFRSEGWKRGYRTYLEKWQS